MPNGRRHRRSTTLRLGWVCAASGLAFAVGPASAQDETRRIERAVREADPAQRSQLDTTLGLTERSSFDIGGSAGMSYIYLTDSDDNSRRLFQPDITLYARASVDGVHNFFGRARFQYRAFSEGDSFDERGDRWSEPFLDRYFYEFDMRRAAAAYEGRTLDWNFNIRVGRQLVDWGAGLALSETLYSVRPTFEFGRFRLEGLAGVTPSDESVIDFDASRDDFDTDTQRGYFGGRLVYAFPSGDQLYGFVLRQQDYNDDDGDTRVGLPVDVEFDYDSWYLGLGATGSFTPSLLYLAEFVYEAGNSMSDPLQDPAARQFEEDISAFAARGELTWLLRDAWRTRFQAEALFASGDDDRQISTDTVGGNRPGTDDTGFNSLGFVNTGLAFSPSFSNVMIYRLGASTFPLLQAGGSPDFQVGADVLFHSKLDADAPIDEPTNDSSWLGFETDLFVNWRIMSDLSLGARYGVFFPSDTLQTETDARHFVFVGITLTF